MHSACEKPCGQLRNRVVTLLPDSAFRRMRAICNQTEIEWTPNHLRVHLAGSRAVGTPEQALVQGSRHGVHNSEND
jgi:hypothetical protein